MDNLASVYESGSSSVFMAVIAFVSLIPLVFMCCMKNIPQYVSILLFAVEFLFIGISTTGFIFPGLTFREIVRKPVMIVVFAVIFSLISIILSVYLLRLKIDMVVLILSSLTSLIAFVTMYRQDRFAGCCGSSYGVMGRNIYNIVLLSIISVVCICLPPFKLLPLWEGLCLPFMLFLPGYYLVNAVIPQMDELSYMERAISAIFGSAVLTSVTGIILIEIRGVLHPAELTLIIIGLTILTVIFYCVKIRKVPREDRFHHQRTENVLRIITILALIGMIAGGIYVENQAVTQNSTDFEITGLNKTAGENNYTDFAGNEEVLLDMHITSHEYEQTNYTLKIIIHNQTADNSFTEEKFTLNNNQTKVIPERIIMTPGEKDIQFILYRNNKPYRIKHLFANVTGDSVETE